MIRYMVYSSILIVSCVNSWVKEFIICLLWEHVATDAVKQHFQDCVSSFTGTVTLQYLSRLEKKLAKHFKFMEFGQLHQGSFLDFLVKNMQVCLRYTVYQLLLEKQETLFCPVMMNLCICVQILQDAAGGVVAIGNQDIRANGFRPSQQDVYEFIKQCGETDPSRVSPGARLVTVRTGYVLNLISTYSSNWISC